MATGAGGAGAASDQARTMNMLLLRPIAPIVDTAAAEIAGKVVFLSFATQNGRYRWRWSRWVSAGTRLIPPEAGCQEELPVISGEMSLQP